MKVTAHLYLAYFQLHLLAVYHFQDSKYNSEFTSISS